MQGYAILSWTLGAHVASKIGAKNMQSYYCTIIISRASHAQ